MLRSVKSLQDYKVKTLQAGQIGTIQDFYFDDHDWTIRYLAVETETILSGRGLLISPEAITGANELDKSFSLNLTQDQMVSSPDIDTEKPISHHQEAALRSHYGWTPLDSQADDFLTPPPVLEEAVQADGLETEEPGRGERDNHLGSMNKVLSYSVQARDGDAGHVEDFLVDDQNWTLQYLVVDTRNWLPGRKVMVSPSWIDWIDWSEGVAHINLSQETIQKSPDYDQEAPVEPELEERAYDHQDRASY